MGRFTTNRQMNRLRKLLLTLILLSLSPALPAADNGMPEFVGISQWLNTDKPLTKADLKGKVVMVAFWTQMCGNCINTLPYVNEWYAKYHGRDLEIIGVHTPEFFFEKGVKKVESAIRKHQIRYPVALDNDYATWNAYSNRYWPAHYFIDKKGRIRYQHFGEGNYENSEKIIQKLLAEPE